MVCESRWWRQRALGELMESLGGRFAGVPSAILWKKVRHLTQCSQLSPEFSGVHAASDSRRTVVCVVLSTITMKFQSDLGDRWYSPLF